MNQSADVIGYMKKVSLSFEAGTTQNNMNLSEQPFSFQFIYGVGTEGVCLFEKALFEKRPGEKILLQVDPHQTGEIFGHLKQRLVNFLPMNKPFCLKTTITAIETADNREIVESLAKGTGSSDCGCGCDGDCAC